MKAVKAGERSFAKIFRVNIPAQPDRVTRTILCSEIFCKMFRKAIRAFAAYSNDEFCNPRIISLDYIYVDTYVYVSVSPTQNKTFLRWYIDTFLRIYLLRSGRVTLLLVGLPLVCTCCPCNCGGSRGILISISKSDSVAAACEVPRVRTKFHLLRSMEMRFAR